MSTLLAKHKKKMTEIRKEIHSICDKVKTNETNVKLREALKAGQTSVDIPFIARGREYTNNYNLPKIISALSSEMYCDVALFLDNRPQKLTISF